MKTPIGEITLLWMLLLLACTKEPEPSPAPAPLPADDNRICWNITAATDMKSRSLIGNEDLTDDSEEFANEADGRKFYLQKALRTVCDAGLGKDALGIGIAADYTYTSNGKTVRVEDIYNYRNNRQLKYYNPADYPQMQSVWAYSTDKDDYEYWLIGGQYTFRAFFPYSELVDKGMIHPSSNCQNFVINYNSQLCQEDLMVGVCMVDTEKRRYRTEGEVKAPQEKWWSHFDLGDAVPVRLEHALSALRFEICYGFQSQGELKAFWFENTSDTKGLRTVGTFVYGSVSGSDDDRIQDLDWSTYQVNYSGDGTTSDSRFFRWEVPASKQGGDAKNHFRIETTETFENGERKLNYVHKAVPYFCNEEGNGLPHSNPGNEFTNSEMTRHRLYTRNHGWILIPPQLATDQVKICLQTDRSKSNAEYYSIHLPGNLGTAVVYDRGVSDKQDERIVAYGKTRDMVERYGGRGYTILECFLPGYKYQFKITLSSSSAMIHSVSVEDWNELISSTEIVF